MSADFIVQCCGILLTTSELRVVFDVQNTQIINFRWHELSILAARTSNEQGYAPPHSAYVTSESIFCSKNYDPTRSFFIGGRQEHSKLSLICNSNGCTGLSPLKRQISCIYIQKKSRYLF